MTGKRKHFKFGDEKSSAIFGLLGLFVGLVPAVEVEDDDGKD